MRARVFILYFGYAFVMHTVNSMQRGRLNLENLNSGRIKNFES